MFQNQEEVNSYLEGTCDTEGVLLGVINRETYLKETMPHMLSGHYQGRVLSMISKMLAPKKILEIGTFTGYATLCLAEGLDKEGTLHTIDINEEQEERVLGYFERSEYASQIKYHIGDAINVIPTIEGEFDLVFIDADKKRNLIYYEMLIDRIPTGGVILLDNVLWKGKVFESNPDNQTRQVLELNATLAKDNRVEKLILPIRDGLFVLRKK
ncbi:O-methyltransferase [Sphingobacterium yanglingense]|uniref:Putative O-methyltransferase YrrM n=1 Tax=Sphingobacterium yanglingense TaxID=1437280 RepID=A0A4R6WEX4_9SPHI|nr:class I SAM-dependent methyltransferase [Sphingobacterium yanglingense]TDQ76026.1 putative O-methyltransferase YrrM [Sphingobacterium yanglingense]